MITEQLRRKIRKQMTYDGLTTKQKMKADLKREILYKFNSEEKFNKAFEKAWRKHTSNK